MLMFKISHRIMYASRPFPALKSAIEHLNLVISSSVIHCYFIDDPSMYHRRIIDVYSTEIMPYCFGPGIQNALKCGRANFAVDVFGHRSFMDITHNEVDL